MEQLDMRSRARLGSICVDTATSDDLPGSPTPVLSGRRSSPVFATEQMAEFDELALRTKKYRSKRPPPPPKPCSPTAIISTKKVFDEYTMLLEEIFVTEQSYVDSLCIIVTHFMQPLHQCIMDGNDIISESTLHSIFSNVQQLMSLNLELLRIIESQLELQLSTRNEDLADALTTAFKAIIPFFKMYSMYVNNYPVAVEVLKSEQNRNKKFADFLAKKELDPVCRGLGLPAYLITPIQRLCKYPLLFSKLDSLSADHNPAKASIRQVAQVVIEITSHVDLDRDRSERSLRTFEIANIIGLDNLSKTLGRELHLLEAHRVLCYEWRSLMTRTFKRSGCDASPRTVFLFSNLLLISKKAGSKGYEARSWMLLDEIELVDVESGSKGPSTPTNKRSSLKKQLQFQSTDNLEDMNFAFTIKYIPVKIAFSKSSRVWFGNKQSPKPEDFVFYFAEEVSRNEAYDQVKLAIECSSKNTSPRQARPMSLPATVASPPLHARAKSVDIVGLHSSPIARSKSANIPSGFETLGQNPSQYSNGSYPELDNIVASNELTQLTSEMAESAYIQSGDSVVASDGLKRLTSEPCKMRPPAPVLKKSITSERPPAPTLKLQHLPLKGGSMNIFANKPVAVVYQEHEAVPRKTAPSQEDVLDKWFG